MGTAPHFLQARTMRDTKIELKSVKADFSLSVQYLAPSFEKMKERKEKRRKGKKKQSNHY